ncbi:UNVERIFIED_CONTAM: peptide maturation system acyl carrier-related protein [Acetivibrio alkalicellulosi]
MYMKQEIIIDKILLLLKEKFNRDYLCKWEELKNKNLLGYEINFQPRDLVYLFFEIEQVFSITIPSDYIINGEFNNLQNIISIISREVHLQKACSNI